MIVNKGNTLTIRYVSLIRFNFITFTHLNISSVTGMISHYKNRNFYDLAINVLIFKKKIMDLR